MPTVGKPRKMEDKLMIHHSKERWWDGTGDRKTKRYEDCPRDDKHGIGNGFTCECVIQVLVDLLHGM